MKKIRFIVNGLGLGNSTRCHAVIQRLKERGADISVATSENGIWYFKDKPEINRLDQLRAVHYGAKDGQISVLRTFTAAPHMLGVLRDNMRLMTQLLKEEKPDAVVTDSDYSFFPMKRLGIPIIALNNSDVVVQSKARYGGMPASVRGQYYGVERLDFLFHKLVPNLVISPSLEPDIASNDPKFLRVSAIVRNQYKPSDSRDPPKRIVIMLSGSVFGSPVVLKQESYPFQIDVVGRGAPDGWQDRDGIKYHSKVLDNSALLDAADLVVVNGGFSAISEVFCMRKPMVVIPVPCHAEQWANGQAIERMGVGLVAEEKDLEATMLTAFSRINDFRSAYRKLPEMQDGAAQAADEILHFLSV